MNRLFYELACTVTRFVGGMSVHHRVVHGRRLQRAGPFVLACTHLGHLEPAFLSVLVPRPVHWLAREEYFRRRAAAWAFGTLGAIPVDRRGVPVRAMRRALDRLRVGGVVGIFPEGGRTHGNDRVTCGGPLKGGAAALALRSGAPIMPVVMLGIDALHAVGPWLPGRRTLVQSIVGPPLWPVPLTRGTRRAARHALTERLRRTFVDLSAELQGGGG